MRLLRVVLGSFGGDPRGRPRCRRPRRREQPMDRQPDRFGDVALQLRFAGQGMVVSHVQLDPLGHRNTPPRI